MFRIIKKADILLAVLLLLLGAVSAFFAYTGGRSGETVSISVQGKLYGTYPLDEDRTVVIRQHGHFNKVIIKDLQVQMAEADCRNQVCVEEGSISRTNQTIVCLPNQVVVSIDGKEADYDALAQ